MFQSDFPCGVISARFFWLLASGADVLARCFREGVPVRLSWGGYSFVTVPAGLLKRNRFCAAVPARLSGAVFLWD